MAVGHQKISAWLAHQTKWPKADLSKSAGLGGELRGSAARRWRRAGYIYSGGNAHLQGYGNRNYPVITAGQLKKTVGTVGKPIRNVEVVCPWRIETRGHQVMRGITTNLRD